MPAIRKTNPLSTFFCDMPCQQFQKVDFTCRIQQTTCILTKDVQFSKFTSDLLKTTGTF